MRAHYLQHAPVNGQHGIERLLEAAGYRVSHTRLYETPDLPDPDSFDLLVVTGAPISANDDDKYPWLASEQEWIRRVHEEEKSILGICLGAQLIARALGADVIPAPQKEIGWFPIEGVAHSDPDLFQFPDSLRVFHWHGENLQLPAGAKRIARSPACENQAFQIGPDVIGLQFHLESSPQSVRRMVTNCREELVPSPYVQTAEEILAAGPDAYRTINDWLYRILTFLGKENRKRGRSD